MPSEHVSWKIARESSAKSVFFQLGLAGQRCARYCLRQTSRTQYGSVGGNNHRETSRFVPRRRCQRKNITKLFSDRFPTPELHDSVTHRRIATRSSATSKVFGLISFRFFRPEEPYNINKVLLLAVAINCRKSARIIVRGV